MPVTIHRLEVCVALSTKPILPVLLLASALVPTSTSTRAQPQREAEPIGVSGYVLVPDGTPISAGQVGIRSPGISGASTSIERTGRFRLVPNMAGAYQLSVSVPDLAPYRVSVNVPSSRTLRLPVIHLPRHRQE